MLQAKTKEQRKTIFCILEKDNQTTYYSFEDGDVENIMIDGYISFDAMAKIVDFLRIDIKRGVVYKCIKDVFDNENKFCLFTKGEYYLCPKDNTLLANNDKVVYWNKWNNPLECFVEVQNKKTKTK